MLMIWEFSSASVHSLEGHLVFIIGLFELSHKAFIFCEHSQWGIKNEPSRFHVAKLLMI